MLLRYAVANMPCADFLWEHFRSPMHERTVACVVIFGVSMFFSALLYRAYPLIILYPDSVGYLSIAQKLFTGWGVVYDTARTPGYGLLMLGALLLPQPGAFLFWLAAIAFSTNMALVCRFGILVYKKIYAGVILACALLVVEVSMMETFFGSTQALTDFIYSHMVFAAAILIVSGWMRRSGSEILGSFILIGLAMLIRPMTPMILLWTIFFGLLLLGMGARWRRSFSCYQCMFFLLVPFLLWTVRNAVIYGGLYPNMFVYLHESTHLHALYKSGDNLFGSIEENEQFAIAMQTMTLPADHNAQSPFGHAPGTWEGVMIGYLASLTDSYKKFGSAAYTKDFSMLRVETAALIHQAAMKDIRLHPVAYVRNALGMYGQLFCQSCMWKYELDAFTPDPSHIYNVVVKDSSIEPALLAQFYHDGDSYDARLIDDRSAYILSLISMESRFPGLLGKTAYTSAFIHHLLFLLACVTVICTRKKPDRRSMHMHAVALQMIVLFLIAAIDYAATASVTLLNDERFAAPGSMALHLNLLLGCVLVCMIIMQMLPAWITRTCVIVIDRFKYMMIRLRGYYAQFGQDRWIITSVFAHKRDGYFVDVGASDGKLFNNTYKLEHSYSWNGIAIEANDASFKLLKKNRKSICVHACVDADRRSVDFLEYAGIYGGMTHTSDQDDIMRMEQYIDPEKIRDENGALRTKRKETITLADILDTYNAPAVIDYLSIDTEGSEYEILKIFPFDRYRFVAMTIEHNFHKERRQNIFDLLTKNGYRRVRSLGVDDCYVLAS